MSYKLKSEYNVKTTTYNYAHHAFLILDNKKGSNVIHVYNTLGILSTNHIAGIVFLCYTEITLIAALTSRQIFYLHACMHS